MSSEGLHVVPLEGPYKVKLSVPFESSQQAGYVRACLAVDEELQPTKISKRFDVQRNVLIVEFCSTELKVLRVAVSSFMDMLLVCTKTLLEFDS